VALPSSCLKLRAPAKVNLALAVLGHLPDGYHRVETVLQTVSLWDEVTLTARPRGITIACREPGVPTDETNLCYQAAALLSEFLPPAPRRGVAIGLRKHIPMQAGLGGGSSDAAATLVGLKRLWGLRLHRAQLQELAARLSADGPFFVEGGCALATGRGDSVERVGAGPRLHFVLVRQGPGVSTAWAYAKRLPRSPKGACQAMARAAGGASPTAIAGLLHNDLEAAVLPERPDIADLKAHLLSEGALGALMAGSGAAVFGIFPTHRAAQESAARMSKNGIWARAVHSIGRGVVVEAADTPTGRGATL